MSDAHSEDTGFIKTPTQLIVIVVLAFAVLIGIPVMVSQLVTSGSKQGADHPAMAPEEVARRIKPVGDVVVADPNAPKVLKAGKEIVEQVCQACHATGALKAPKIGDNAAWGALAKQGLATLTASAVKGKNAMPAKGGNPDLSDVEIARAIAYMANQSGGNMKEPEAAPAADAPKKK
mgnify:CR=1 FL=1